jgi:ATP-binding cassette subfamily B protein
MTHGTLDFAQFVKTLSPFNRLPEDELQALLGQCKPVRYRMGQIVLMRGKQSHFTVLLCEGQMRSLGYDPRNQMPATLELLKPGAVLGVANAIRGVPSETAIASTEAIGLIFPKETFLDLMGRYHDFGDAFRQSCTPLELFEIIGYQLLHRARGDGDLKQLTQNLLPDCQVHSLPNGLQSLPDDSPLFDPQWRWFVSNQSESFPVGSEITKVSEMSVGELEGMVGNLRESLEQARQFVSEQEEELTEQMSAIADLEARLQFTSERDRQSLLQKLVYEREKGEMLEATLTGQRYNLQQQQASYEHYRNLLQEQEQCLENQNDKLSARYPASSAVSGGKNGEFTKSNPLTAESKNEAIAPLRLVGVRRDRWQKFIGAPVTSAVVPEIVTDSEQLSVDYPADEIPYADTALVGTAPPVSAESSGSRQTYPFIRGKSPLESSSACFQMLSQYFGMPFRRDVIRRVLAEQLDRSEKISLPVAGAIAELMGLNAQLIAIPASSLTQVAAPALVQWQGGLAILYEISDRHIVVAIPEKGILRLPPQTFLEQWEERGEVLLLQKSKETPQERFGLRWFLPALSKYRRVLTEVFVASFFVQLFGLANPLMIQVIIDKVIVQNSADTLQVLGIFLLVIAVFEAILTTLRTYLFVDTTNRIDMSLGSEIIDHLLRLPLRYFEKRPVGEISTRVNELENIRQFLTGTALTVVLDAVFSIIYIIVMVIYSPLLTLVALGIVPLFIGLTLIFSPTIRRQLRVKAERNAQTQSYLVEVMSGIQTVKAQNIELRSRWQWQDKYSRYVSAGFNTVITSTFASSVSQFLNKLSGLLVLWVGAYLVLDGKLSLGQLIAFRIIASYVTSPILRLTQLWQNFQETALSLERLADIVDTPQEAEQDRDNIPMPAIEGAVKFDRVNFRFKPHGPLNLIDVDLNFPAGTFVAVVGQSGAGKSTLTKLLSRLYEPESGRILIDGYDIAKVELYSLRRQIGVVPQDTLLFEGTVQENIALTNPDANTEEIIAAAQVAAAHEFIMGLPNGYNTRVGERGSSLSGGQRQRIAIARSVLQSPRILVLDEATSALDYATEQQVCTNLLNAFSDRTVFFITHRLGSIRGADVIVMMDAGAVVEIGSHAELMALGGRYCYLYQQQEAGI